MKNLKFLTTLLIVNVFLFTACDKDDDGHSDNEQELITTVKLTFMETGGTTIEFSVKDLDGDGGNPPVVDTITLKANTAYTIGVELLDESEAGHTHHITDEVKEESNSHLICFEATGSMTKPVIGDVDSDGYPLGLECSVTTGTAGTGTLKVTLKHEPDKSTAAPCSTGETDAEVTFPVVVE